jgi:hypothetical protein
MGCLPVQSHYGTENSYHNEKDETYYLSVSTSARAFDSG